MEGNCFGNRGELTARLWRVQAYAASRVAVGCIGLDGGLHREQIGLTMPLIELECGCHSWMLFNMATMCGGGDCGGDHLVVASWGLGWLGALAMHWSRIKGIVYNTQHVPVILAREGSIMEAALVAGRRTRADAYALHFTGAAELDVRCLCCGAPAYFGGNSSEARGYYFSHAPTKQSEKEHPTYCALRSKNERRFSWVKPLERNREEGEGLRRRFLDDAQLRKAFAFCLRTVNSNPALSAETFASLLKVADGLDLWSLKGLTPVTLSMLLLTLEDLPSQSRDQRPLWYRFELSKPRGLREIDVSGGELSISKHFVNRDGSTGPLLSKGRNHHVEVGPEEFERIAGAGDWVSLGTLIAIRRRASY